MLLRENITDFASPSQEWLNNKLAKFSSSEIYLLCAEEGIGKTGMNYIYRKVGEELSGRAAKDDILTSATAHGNEYEIEGILEFAKVKEIPSFEKKIPIVQRFVNGGERCGSTPDGLWLITETLDGTAYSDARTIEVKCPYSYDAYIRLWKCKTPQDVKALSRQYYFQVLDQLLVCGCLVGYLVIYQPFFRAGKINIIEFKKAQKVGEKFPIVEDLKILDARKKEATKIFNDTRDELIMNTKPTIVNQ
jgi:hypothetical protein